jgi:hypothetical protein
MFLTVVLFSVFVLMVIVAGGVWATRSLQAKSAADLSLTDELDESLIGAANGGPGGLLF